MAWLCVNGMGEEYIFQERPATVRCVSMDYFAPSKFVCSDWKGGVLLPRGSIKKLIGRELTFNDGPVELKEE